MSARKNKFGKKYDPKFCQELIDHGQTGESLAAFAQKKGISLSTLYEWARKDDDFDEAMHIAKTAQCAFWEKIGVNIMIGRPLDPSVKVQGNAQIWMFIMRRRFREFGYEEESTQSNGPDGFEV